MGAPLEITPKMRVFADEYISGEHTGKPWNAKAAGIYAGYSVRSAPYLTQLPNHPLVQKYVKARLDELSMSAGEVLKRFTDIARSNVGSIVKKNAQGTGLELDVDAVIELKDYIKSFTFDANGLPRIEFQDSFAALTQIARIRGMMKDGLEITGAGGGPVTMTVLFVDPNAPPTAPVPELSPGQDEDIPIAAFEVLESDDANIE